MANTMLEAVGYYINDNPDSTLTTVDMVIVEPTSVKDFARCLKTAAARHATRKLWHNVEMSEWLTRAEIGKHVWDRDVTNSLLPNMECQGSAYSYKWSAIQNITQRVQVS